VRQNEVDSQEDIDSLMSMISPGLKHQII